jgi:hypothetical protein
MTDDQDLWTFCRDLQRKTPTEITRFFETICRVDWRPDLERLARVLAGGLAIDEPRDMKGIGTAARCAAASPGAGNHAYHNLAHTAHVAIVAAYLAGRVTDMPLSQHERACVLLAAFGHDIDHPGRGNPADDPFCNERRSVDRLLPLLDGYTDDDKQKIATMILATSPNEPHQDLKHILSTRQTRFKELGLLTGDRRLFEMTAILSDADIMMSSGLGEEVNAEMGLRFGRETRLSTGHAIDFNAAASRWAFFEKIVGLDGYLSQAGRQAFLPNYVRFREKTRAETLPAPPLSPRD